MSNLAIQLDFGAQNYTATANELGNTAIGLPGTAVSITAAPPAQVQLSPNGSAEAQVSQPEQDRAKAILKSMQPVSNNPMKDSKDLRRHAGIVEQKTGQQQLQKSATGAPSAPKNSLEMQEAALSKYNLSSSRRVLRRNYDVLARLSQVGKNKKAAATQEKPAPLNFITKKVVSVGNEFLNNLTRRAGMGLLKAGMASLSLPGSAVYGIGTAINLTKPESFDHSTPEDGAVNLESKPAPKIKTQPALMQEPSQPPPRSRRPLQQLAA